MIHVKKNGREAYAMVMNESVNGVLGVVQCGIKGCQAYTAVMADLGKSGDQIHKFMMEHDCDPRRFKLNARLA